MNQAKISVAVLAASAGFACSVASAGGPLGMANNKAPAATPSVASDVASATRGVPAPQVVKANIRRYSESEMHVIDPVKVYVNGRSVPFTISDTVGGGAEDLVPTIAYDSAASTGSGTASTWYTATAGTAATPINAAFDDAILTTSGATTLTTFRLRFGTSAAISAATTVWIGVQWYDGFNAGGSPVNTGLAGTFLEQFTAPTTGWAGNSVYYTRYVTSSFLPLSFQTAGSNGGFEWLGLNDDGTGSPDVTTNPDLLAVFNSNAVTAGSSVNGIYFANNVLDGNGNGQYNGPAITFVDSSNNPLLSNLALGAIATSAPNSSYQACCLPGLPGGGCVTLVPAVCTAQGGVSKAQTNCALITANQCSGFDAGVIFNNGPISTGTTVSSGATSPVLPSGARWSETPIIKNANPAVTSVCIGNIIGASALAGSVQRYGEDFTVPAGENWTVSGIRLYTYLSGGASTTNPVVNANIAVWKGFPDAVGSTKLSDNTALAPSSSASIGIYRNGALAVGTAAPTLGRLVWQSTFTLPSALVLTPGTYYITYNITGFSTSTFLPLVTIAKDPNQFTGGAWVGTGHTLSTGDTNAIYGFYSGTNPGVWGGYYDTVIDDFNNAGTWTQTSNPGVSTCVPYNVAMPFSVVGSKATINSCYANCDGSTGTPALTAADFTCFLTKFRANDSYANCDGSTGVPSLTAADFTCFLTKFRAGCP